MRSRAELRSAVEWLLRAALLVALGVALWHSLRRDEVLGVSRVVPASAMSSGITDAMRTTEITSLVVSMDVIPSRADRDALAALRRAGVAVSWHGAVPALAMEIVRVREPDARSLALLTSDAGPALALTDSAGLIDSVSATGGATVDAATVVGGVRAVRGGFAAIARPAPAEPRRAVLVLGRADWETKFVMQALTESGWVVRGRIPTAPAVTVRDDGLLPIDTSRYDVVIALDSSAADLASNIARFVAQGGGLIAAGGALTAEPLRALVPAHAGDRKPGRILLGDDTVTTRDLPMRALVALRTDALPLQHEAGGVTLAARRAGSGRVLAVGYDESWRWRMLGGESGLPSHRRWWSAAAGSVAPERNDVATQGADAAPLAALVNTLGAPSAVAVRTNSPARNPLPLGILVIIVATLLAETASRRFRGAR
jgi:hypothetical protein